MSQDLTANQIAEVISEVFPYIKQFRKKIIVVKFGGHAMVDDELKNQFASDVALLNMVGFKVVLVHGGGPQIAYELKNANLKSEFINGLRVTTKAVMEVVQKVLVEINQSLVDLINQHLELGTAKAITRKDCDLFFCEPVNNQLGLVGNVKKIDTSSILKSLNNFEIPVVCPIGIGKDKQSYNINADWAASKLATSLQAEKLILLTDTTGVLDENNSLIANLKIKQTEKLMNQGIIKGGMIPKVECAIQALEFGVNRAHIIDGRITHAILIELLTNKGIGTVID